MQSTGYRQSHAFRELEAAVQAAYIAAARQDDAQQALGQLIDELVTLTAGVVRLLPHELRARQAQAAALLLQESVRMASELTPHPSAPPKT
jgi:hypothetical protein